MLVAEDHGDLGDLGELCWASLSLHARVEHGEALAPEGGDTGVAPAVAKDVEPSVGAFRHGSRREEAVGAWDDVHPLHPEGVAATKHRRGVVRIADVLQHRSDSMGPALYDLADALEAPLGDHRPQGFDDELWWVPELRRTGASYLEDVGVVASHGRTMPPGGRLASLRALGQTRRMDGPEQRSWQGVRTVVPAAGALYLGLALLEVLAPHSQRPHVLAACCALSGLALWVLAHLLRKGVLAPNTVATGGSAVAMLCGLAFVLLGEPPQALALVITLLGLGSFLALPRVMIASALFGLGGWGAIAWHRGAAPGELRVWGTALVASAAFGIGLAFARRRLIRSIKTQIGVAERERARAEEVARELAARTEELERTRDQALASVEAKQRFLAHVSHEIRTPLNGILGLLELLERSRLDPQQRERLQQVRRSGDALLAIVNDLLDLSRIEAGALTLEAVPFDVGRVVEEVTSNHAAAAHAKGLELLVQLDPALPARVFGDPLRLRQVLTNLVSNAIKFTRRGEVVVRCHLDGRTDEEATLLFGVSDTGIGMSAEELTRVFAPFGQADESTTREFGGTGLGLAIARQLVELMGGELIAESVKGEGSVFSFAVTFPLADTLSGEGLQISSALMEARVLLVDANPRVRGNLCGHLQSWGVMVDVASDSAAADRKLREALAADAPYTVALVDLRTLGDDWAELTASLADNPAYGRPRIVAMSAGLVDPSEDRRRDGLFAALSKPILRRQLLATVAQAHQARPVRPGRVTSRHLERREPTGEQVLSTQIRVLVVEDQPTNRVVSQGFLEELGYVPVLATHGEEAVRIVREEGDFGLVLMDCQMPVMDGYEATRRIRALERELGRRRLPIVALTAHAFPAERERTREAGMDGHLTKPLTMEALREVLLRWCPPGEALDPEAIEELASLGGGAFLRRMIAAYRSSAKSRLRAMVDAAARNELDLVRQNAHALKGAARQMGAHRLGDLMADLEDQPSRFERWRPIVEAERERVEVALDVWVRERT